MNRVERGPTPRHSLFNNRANCNALIFRDLCQSTGEMLFVTRHEARKIGENDFARRGGGGVNFG